MRIETNHKISSHPEKRKPWWTIFREKSVIRVMCDELAKGSWWSGNLYMSGILGLVLAGFIHKLVLTPYLAEIEAGFLFKSTPVNFIIEWLLSALALGTIGIPVFRIFFMGSSKLTEILWFFLLFFSAGLAFIVGGLAAIGCLGFCWVFNMRNEFIENWIITWETFIGLYVIISILVLASDYEYTN